jgi:hypothetical protein
VGFESTIPASERAKTVHASDRSATVTGPIYFYIKQNTELVLHFSFSILLAWSVLNQVQAYGKTFTDSLKYDIWILARFVKLSFSRLFYDAVNTMTGK